MTLESGHSVEKDLEGRWRLGEVVQRTHPVHIALEDGKRVIYIDTAAWDRTTFLSERQDSEALPATVAPPALWPVAHVCRVVSGAQRVRKAMAAKASSGATAQRTIPDMVRGMQDQPSGTLVARVPTEKYYPGQQLTIEQMWPPPKKGDAVPTQAPQHNLVLMDCDSDCE